MSIQLVSTWKMSFAGMKDVWSKIGPQLEAGIKNLECPWEAEGTPWSKEEEMLGFLIQEVIRQVEDDENLHSVGSGGLPGKKGIVELDAAYMNASTLGIGAVMAVRNIKNPIVLARYLSRRRRNCILAGLGAESLAKKLKMEETSLLTPQARTLWEKALKQKKTENPYEEYGEGSHDTVCVLGRWNEHHSVGVSTSGLFMKEEGRIGDSPLIGSGFYAKKKVGSAAATGLGEDIMRGCLSYTVVALMEEGYSPQQACEKALLEWEGQLKDPSTSISLIALGENGEVGASTTMEMFPFVVAEEKSMPQLMCVYREGKQFYIQEADAVFYDNYTGD